jgi:nitrogen-specific signal transduction histidine kinase
MMNALIYYFFNFSNKTLRRFDFLGANLKNVTIYEGRLDIKLMKQVGNLPPIERYAARINQAFLNILNHAIDVLEESAQKL